MYVCSSKKRTVTHTDPRCFACTHDAKDGEFVWLGGVSIPINDGGFRFVRRYSRFACGRWLPYQQNIYPDTLAEPYTHAHDAHALLAALVSQLITNAATKNNNNYTCLRKHYTQHKTHTRIYLADRRILCTFPT